MCRCVDCYEGVAVVSLFKVFCVIGQRVLHIEIGDVFSLVEKASILYRLFISPGRDILIHFHVLRYAVGSVGVSYG